MSCLTINVYWCLLFKRRLHCADVTLNSASFHSATELTPSLGTLQGYAMGRCGGQWDKAVFCAPGACWTSCSTLMTLCWRNQVLILDEPSLPPLPEVWRTASYASQVLLKPVLPFLETFLSLHCGPELGTHWRSLESLIKEHQRLWKLWYIYT